MIGADDSLNLEVKVRNDREDAFESQFFLSVPPGLEYIAYKRLSKVTLPLLPAHGLIRWADRAWR